MSPQRDLTRPRPNPLQPYQCGFHKLGVGCLVGPTADGQCCQAVTGGCDRQDCGTDCPQSSQCQIADQKRVSCENRQQFQKCIPIRSHWYWRNKLALNLAILTSGLLLACLSLSNYERFFVPGELSRGHSQILENTLVSDRCSLCHTTAHGGNAGRTQEQLCMNCHNSHMPDALAGNPHDLTPPQFSRLIAFHNGSSESQLSQPANHSATRCASCHIEHHGGDQDLKAMTDARCQACHQQQFTSFSLDHPEFRSFPYDTRRRIAFDHVAHAEKYFGQKNSSFDCQQCHDTDAESPSHIRRTASFEVACASCHAQPLQASSADGWAVLQLPSLHPGDVAAGGEPLANWPSTALYGYDGKLSLPMRLLLSEDAKVAEALRQFAQGDLSQAKAGDPVQQAAVRTVAAAVRQLLRDTAERGQEAWKQRLTSVASTALQREPTQAELQLIRAMVSGLPPDLFRQMEDSWFGKPSGIADRGQKRISANLINTRELLSPQDLLLDDDSNSAAESDDELLRSNSAPGAIAESPAQKHSGSRLTATSSIGQGGWYLDSQLLLLKYMPSGHADPVVAAWVQFAALVDATRPQAVTAGQAEPVDLQPWHLSSWKPGSEAVGGCTECHLLPNYASQVLTSGDWRSEAGAAAKPFTKFSHKPHMTLAVTADCKHCHQFNKSVDSRYAELAQALSGKAARWGYDQAAQQHFRCEFQAMEKSQCNACHRAGGASEGCTQCHNYHIGTSGLESMHRAAAITK